MSVFDVGDVMDSVSFNPMLSTPVSKAIRLHDRVIQVSHITPSFVRFRQIMDDEFIPRKWSKARLYTMRNGKQYFQIYGCGRIYLDELVAFEDVCVDCVGGGANPK